jgi:hypothetical protein
MFAFGGFSLLKRKFKRGGNPLKNYFPLPYQREGDQGGGLHYL